jgi:hypothetical protein
MSRIKEVVGFQTTGKEQLHQRALKTLAKERIEKISKKSRR